ncbi:cbb3-type cytochrome c oxidase N-terminal domain-containing protein [Galbibacter orientalis]|uniref:Cytochrome c, mono-and diheme variants family n=1 Tax=Galbibacter orientalis DSM 19592 TaxID=926559 RepID=I3C5C2_9FLAO|nr:cbb3-type cytochrome c oxidase N-terminal domain-containing protein [Galbibacter orientalis]EIJ38815.1 cytochrome c, mono- and diheme variants family [Galbibacter orientalis DSM 19592]
MRNFTSYLRVLLIVFIVFCAAEYFIDSGSKPAFIEYPQVAIFLVLFTLLLVAVEIVVASMNSLTKALLSEEQLKEAEENSWYKNLLKKLTKTKPIEEEGEIILDHNYDGIKELDNSLPPWWLYGFYASILFAAIYLIKYEVLNGDSQKVEYEKEVAAAKIAIEEYKKTAVDLVDAKTVVALTEDGDIKKGAEIFKINCVACHRADGGGAIGPNLTDDYWILGGGIKNIFHTITEGGRSGKGMIAWKQSLKPSEIQLVASYILTLHGTNPTDPKEPEGDIWKEAEVTE